MNSTIEKIYAREILDSRGNPTVEVDIITKSGEMGRASVPSGASTGEYEAIEMRDLDNKRYLGKGVQKAIDNINNISKELIGINTTEQRKIDRLLIDLDNTENKSNLGANAILGISLAIAHVGAKVSDKPLYKYLANDNHLLLPMPMMNILNGEILPSPFVMPLRMF